MTVRISRIFKERVIETFFRKYKKNNNGTKEHATDNYLLLDTPQGPDNACGTFTTKFRKWNGEAFQQTHKSSLDAVAEVLRFFFKKKKNCSDGAAPPLAQKNKQHSESDGECSPLLLPPSVRMPW